MKPSERILHQRHKEQRVLKLFLGCSVLGSLMAHAIAMTVQVGNFWNPATPAYEDDLEVVVEDAPVDPPTVEKMVADPPEPPTAVATAQDVAIAAQLAPAPLPLAPSSQAPLPAGQDAPGKDAPASPNDPVTPLTNQTGENPTQSGGSGPITSPDGQGFGFGFGGFGAGFNLNGKPTGKPNGQPGEQEDGKAGGVPNGQSDGQVNGDPAGKPDETATRTAPPKSDRAPQPVCLECPKPKYRGSEGSPRVTYDIGSDGRVTNVRLRQSSGNSDLDRETLETFSKWRFDPKTIPDGGRQNVRVRVTFEEEGSNYQRQNEQRRQVADQEQPQPTAPQRQPTAAANESPAKPASTPAKKTETLSPRYPQGVAPIDLPAPVRPPVETVLPAPLGSEPLPVEVTPLPAPVEVAPPASSLPKDPAP